MVKNKVLENCLSVVDKINKVKKKVFVRNNGNGLIFLKG